MLAQLQLATKSQKLLDELLFLTRAQQTTVRVTAVRLLARIAMSADEQSTQQIVDKLTELLKASDSNTVNETIIALQTIINQGCLSGGETGESGDSQEVEARMAAHEKTRKVVIVHCAKRLQSTNNSYAKSMMIHLLSK